jgi:hypothetical protein
MKGSRVFRIWKRMWIRWRCIDSVWEVTKHWLECILTTPVTYLNIIISSSSTPAWDRLPSDYPMESLGFCLYKGLLRDARFLTKSAVSINYFSISEPFRPSPDAQPRSRCLGR